VKLIPHILLLLATLSHAADETALRAAIEKSLPLLERSSAIAIQERSNCFTCHHSGLPVMTFLTAQKRGFPVDEVNLKSQLQFTADVLAEGRERYLEGKGQGGAAFMAGSALWTMKLGKWKADANTDAVVEYLLEHQKDLNHWKPPSIRPPSEESPFSATFFALEGILHFASEAQKPRMIVRVKSALEWLEKTAPQTTEDRIFRLQALRAAGGNVDRSVADLLAIQRDDGGWAQLETMGTDAYATATALVALHRAGGLPVADEKYQRGIAWLIDAQLPDGSWHVVSRSKPIQKYFESGYPHGKDQFISITAASWATTALLDALGPVPQDIVFKAAVDGSEQRYVELMPPGYDPAKVHDVVLAFHGHGSDRWQFIKDERGECRGVRNAASKYGQILVSPDYRAKTSWMGPAAEADVVQIIAELRQRHRIGRIFLAGGSMGGTAVLTFTALHPELVAGVCSLNGTANLVEYENFQEARTASFGGTIAEVPEEYRKRSAEFFPDKFTMPVAFTTGGKDKSVPPQSVLRLAEALKQAKRKVLSLHREEGGHSTSYEDTILAMEFMLREAGSLPASERVAYFEKAEALQDRLVNAPEDLRADADLFAKGMNWALRYDTALQPSDLALIKKAAVRGDERAEAILSKKPPWTTKKGKVVRGFISAIDGSTQPYGVIVPKGYDGTKPFRLDVVLHGSSKPVGMSELKFIQRFDEGDLGDSTAPDVDYIELHPLGRVENCYRWAGETDVFEAIEAACRNYRIDRDRIVLRGMSMGASGTWHLGLKHPDRFVAIGPYCGYVDTHRFSETPIPNFIKVGPLPPHQEIALHMLDSVDYAANAGVVPAIAAIGDKDVFFSISCPYGRGLRKRGHPLRQSDLAGHGSCHRSQDPRRADEAHR
jgi:dipeptidyl aminopeptidase/acylaminoacyl peptidase